jgi:homoserine kinase type II
VVRTGSQAELERVLGRYSLGRLRNAQRPEHGFVNDNWIVDTTRGRFFLKHRHPSLSEPAFVRAQHALTIWLRSSGFPAPELKHTTDGKTLCILDGECYEIQEYIAGTHWDHERGAQFDEAARTLARYHHTVSRFAPAALCLPGQLYSPQQVSENLTHVARVWRVSADAELALLADRLEAQVTRLASRFARHGALPGLIIHGDFYADNLLFADDRIVGVVDYDKARWQARVVELAEALIYFATPRPGQFEHLVYPGCPEWTWVNRFLRAYCESAPLEDAEAQAVPDYMQCIWLQMSLCRLRERPERPAHAREALREVLMLDRWAQDSRAALKDACQTASRQR